jgi:hypothetical protein
VQERCLLRSVQGMPVGIIAGEDDGEAGNDCGIQSRSAARTVAEIHDEVEERVA